MSRGKDNSRPRDDAEQVLARAGLAKTPNRALVIRTLARSSTTLSAPELLELVHRERPMNKVTLYRILDLLVENRVAFRHSAGDGTMRYCLGRSQSGPTHIHFYCRSCNAMECLSRDEVDLDLAALGRAAPRQVDSVELRLDGLCAACAEQEKGK